MRSIGMAAPILVVLFRLCRALPWAAKSGPTTAFLLEAAPAQQRGLYVSLQNRHPVFRRALRRVWSG